MDSSNKVQKKLKYKITPEDSTEEKNFEEKKSVVQEEIAFKVPANMYVNSSLALTATNIEAAEEYLEKAQMFHHLWQPNHEIEHI